MRSKIKTVSSALHQTDAAAMPDASGANYISRNNLHRDPGVESGKTHASERVPYKPGKSIAGKDVATPELVGNEKQQVNEPETGTKVNLKPEGFGPSYVAGDVDTVRPVTRDLNPVERARQRNNRSRDQRTNLGRGKPAQPTVE